MPWVVDTSGLPQPLVGTTFTQGVLRDYSPWLNRDSTVYLAALASMFEAVYSIVVDQGDPDVPDLYRPGWSVLLDPEGCPSDFLPFLGQFIGVQVNPGDDPTDARARITERSPWKRGTLAAMTTAAKANLTGSQQLVVLERTAANGTPDAYHMIFEFEAQQCPNVGLLIAAVEAVKPGGIQITYASTQGWAWNEATGEWGQDQFSWLSTNQLNRP